MKETTAVVLINLGVISLTAFSLYYTNSMWSLLILLVMFKTSEKDR